MVHGRFESRVRQWNVYCDSGHGLWIAVVCGPVQLYSERSIYGLRLRHIAMTSVIIVIIGIMTHLTRLIFIPCLVNFYRFINHL